MKTKILNNAEEASEFLRNTIRKWLDSIPEEVEKIIDTLIKTSWDCALTSVSATISDKFLATSIIPLDISMKITQSIIEKYSEEQKKEGLIELKKVIEKYTPHLRGEI